MIRSKGGSFVGFLVDGVEYALHISAVREIVNPAPVSVVPRRPLGVLGITELRKTVMPVLDLRVRLGLLPMPITRRTKWLLLDFGSERLALQVEHVIGVFRADVDAERPAPPMLAQDELCRVLFVTKRGDAMVFALDAAPFEWIAREVSHENRGRPSPNGGDASYARDESEGQARADAQGVLGGFNATLANAASAKDVLR
jgi:purine-binding chemotaxis protein CheW